MLIGSSRHPSASRTRAKPWNADRGRHGRNFDEAVARWTLREMAGMDDTQACDRPPGWLALATREQGRDGVVEPSDSDVRGNLGATRHPDAAANGTAGTLNESLLQSQTPSSRKQPQPSDSTCKQGVSGSSPLSGS